MIEITVTTNVEKPFHSGAGIYLNIAGQAPVKLSFNIEDYARIRGPFDTNAAEFAYFCAVIYGCDRLIERNTGDGDRWTREIAVKIPVRNPAHWEACVETTEKMLEFLTGDIWRLKFLPASQALFGSLFQKTRQNFRKKYTAKGSAVSLFSGGLDSLVGTIDWLEKNPDQSLLLASSYDADAENARDDQNRLLPYLKTHYSNRLSRFVARSGLSSKGADLNFRSRSLTFLGNAVLAASFLKEGTSILIPENGAIALNFPLAASRSGSFSTRTVHPYFIFQFNKLLTELGFTSLVHNPYEFKTKGEVVKECQNPSLLQSIYPESVSCGKRGFTKVNWHDRTERACGHCIPCIFRQAAVAFAKLEEESYGCNVANPQEWGRSNLLKPTKDVQTVIDFLRADIDPKTLWTKMRSNGHLDIERKDDYVDLIIRLRSELAEWLNDKGLL